MMTARAACCLVGIASLAADDVATMSCTLAAPAEVDASYAEKYGERSMSHRISDTGGGVVVFYASESGTWTIISWALPKEAGGLRPMCLLASGVNRDLAQAMVALREDGGL